MPEWNTTERGKMRENEDDDRARGLDGLSCMDLMGLPGHTTGIEDVEDLTVVSDYEAGIEDEDES